MKIEGFNLPRDAKDNFGHAVKSGESTLFVPGTQIRGNTAFIPPGQDPTFGRRGFLHENHRQLSVVTGDKTVLVVKIIVSDGATTFDESELSNSVFGNSVDPVNLKSQYLACSHGKLNFNKAAARTKSGGASGGTSIANGAVTVSLPSRVVADGDGVIRNAVTMELNAMFGVSATSLANHLMYCMPLGAMSGIAYAYINSWNSVFSNQWCTYVSGQMHELGHNLNLAHSNEAGTYKDQRYGRCNSDVPFVSIMSNFLYFFTPKQWYDGILLWFK